MRVKYYMKVEKEHKGLRAFISSEYRNMISYVRRYLNEKYYNVSAEDIIQDVAVNLFSRIDVDDHVGNVAGYVYRSLGNRIKDLQRKPKKEVLFEKFSNEEGEETYSENISDITENEYLEINDERFYELFNKALSKLSPNQQMIFIATEMEGYTFEEVSEELDIPIGTLLSWKHRGVQKLKELIKLDEMFIDNENY